MNSKELQKLADSLKNQYIEAIQTEFKKADVRGIDCSDLPVNNTPSIKILLPDDEIFIAYVRVIGDTGILLDNDSNIDWEDFTDTEDLHTVLEFLENYNK